MFDFLRETFHRHALEYLKPARSEKKSENTGLLFLQKRLTVIDHFEGPWLVETHFRRWRQP